MAPMKERVIVIVGPTAVGKTALSISLAKKVHGEIISADSRQVYRGLNIGTGKVTPDEKEGVPHHMLDIASPNDIFTVSDFVSKGREAISNVIKRGHVPIIVGGTGFYIDALLGKISLAEVPPNPQLRITLELKTTEELFEELQERDPDRADTIDPHNKVRLIRALEIVDALGSVPKTSSESLYEALWIGLQLPKEELESRIHERLIARCNDGMVEEVKKLHAEGLSFERMEMLGLEYRYIARFLQGLLTYNAMLTELESEIKKYAKRQITWFKKNTEINWYEPKQMEEISHTVKSYLSNQN